MDHKLLAAKLSPKDSSIEFVHFYYYLSNKGFIGCLHVYYVPSLRYTQIKDSLKKKKKKNSENKGGKNEVISDWLFLIYLIHVFLKNKFLTVSFFILNKANCYESKQCWINPQEKILLVHPYSLILICFFFSESFQLILVSGF